MTIKKTSNEEEDDLGFRKVIDEKDVEIQRLNIVIGILEAAAKGDLTLIAELANAADLYLYLDGSVKIFDAVKLQGARVKLREQIQRAREATHGT